MLTHFSLFSGIGGIDLASEWAGFTTVGQCELADYPTKVLEKHWPNVPRWRDIRDVTLGSVRDKGISAVDLISGGLPCQPFSTAGKRKGKDDDRYLWPEMLRVISELKPNWVLSENVCGIVNMELEQVCSDLEAQDYEVQAFIIPACGVDAPHQRKRVFIVAHARSWRFCKSDIRGEQQGGTETISASQDVANSNNTGNRTQQYSNDGNRAKVDQGRKEQPQRRTSGSGEVKFADQWELEPNMGRVANGVSNRVDRLKCLGNAVVPAQVYPILQAIAQIEGEK